MTTRRIIAICITPLTSVAARVPFPPPDQRDSPPRRTARAQGHAMTPRSASTTPDPPQGAVRARSTPANVRMYVCGPTVYDRAHIGNARPVVVFDVLFRLLRHVYGEGHVTYVRNITDVDDKINAARRRDRPRRSARSPTRPSRWYHADMAALGALAADLEPRATEFIAPMVAMIETLIARGHAYEAEGHVLFAVASYPDYGRFARRSLDEMRAGARVEVAPYKRDPMDFVLWKPSTPASPAGTAPGAAAAPAGTSSARRCPTSCSAPPSTSTAAASTSSSRTTRTRSPSRRCAHPEAELRPHLDAQRLPERRGREDVEVARQLLHRPRPARPRDPRRGDPLRPALDRTTAQPMDWTEARWRRRRRRCRAGATSATARRGRARGRAPPRRS